MFKIFYKINVIILELVKTASKNSPNSRWLLNPGKQKFFYDNVTFRHEENSFFENVREFEKGTFCKINVLIDRYCFPGVKRKNQYQYLVIICINSKLNILPLKKSSRFISKEE